MCIRDRPDSVKWNGGSAPTLISDAPADWAKQQFQFLTRDSGVTWYAWESYKNEANNWSLFSWGINQGGELGQNQVGPWNGTPAWAHSRSSPTQVGTDTTWSTNINHWGPSDGHSMFAIKTDGTLWTWGYEDNGSLGLNNKGVSQSSPVQIPGTYTSVGGTGMGGSAVKSDGTIWGWGRNKNGQLGQGGLGLSSSRSSPVQMGTDTDWQTVAKGGLRQTGCVKTDGTYYNCGSGDTGSLGHDNTGDQATMTQVPGTYTTNYRQVQMDNAFLIKEV